MQTVFTAFAIKVKLFLLSCSESLELSMNSALH